MQSTRRPRCLVARPRSWLRECVCVCVCVGGGGSRLGELLSLSLSPSGPSLTHPTPTPPSRPAEGPIFFKRGGSYYIFGGTTCCACRGGSSIYVFRAESPLGPWRFVNDVGSNPRPAGAPFDIHDPHAFVTNAQASAVLDVGNDQWLWLGNQWVSSGRRNADLLYWTVLDFDDDGNVRQVVYKDSATVLL